MRGGQIDPRRHRRGLQARPRGDHRRERRDVHDRVHPLHPRDRRRQGLRLHARRRHARLALHRGAADAGGRSARWAARALHPQPGRARRAASQRSRWRFDFMGASKWFFSMSGVILLIGALAIGGKGLNFGIDFESGTRIKTAAATARPTRTACATRSPPSGFGDAKIQRVSGTGARRATPSRSRPRRSRRASATRSSTTLQQKLRGRSASTTTSIGPTFGQTVAKSAMIAIIASLLVISAYIALRFEWKYAVPVLIALMHDLLITAGVYSLHRPGGDDVDGRGAADHPGLLALRHDHRVRPHARERAAHAARRLLADRQPLDERGADAVAGDVVLHRAADRSRCCSSAARRSRTSPSRCSSASSPARTRRSSSPRRC